MHFDVLWKLVIEFLLAIDVLYFGGQNENHKIALLNFHQLFLNSNILTENSTCKFLFLVHLKCQSHVTPPHVIASVCISTLSIKGLHSQHVIKELIVGY